MTETHSRGCIIRFVNKGGSMLWFTKFSKCKDIDRCVLKLTFQTFFE
jgi:hypothetical protein